MLFEIADQVRNDNFGYFFIFLPLIYVITDQLHNDFWFYVVTKSITKNFTPTFQSLQKLFDNLVLG